MASGRRSVAGPPSNAKPKSEPLPVTKSKQAKQAAAGQSGDQKSKVRVWWPPTDDKQKTGFGGAFWPAQVLSTNEKKGTVRVRYDNGEEQTVEEEHISPHDVPVEFGAEATTLEVGEFCEVHNDSKTDPGAWLGRVVKYDEDKDAYLVAYPFHDTKSETIKTKRVRRARILEDGEWRLLRPHQTWEDGEVTSPKELELISEEDLPDALQAADEAKPSKKKKRTSKGAEASNGKAKETGKQAVKEPPKPKPEPAGHAQGTAASSAPPSGMATMYLTMESKAGRLCFVPLEPGTAMPDNAIQAYLPVKAVQRYQSETKKRARK